MLLTADPTCHGYRQVFPSIALVSLCVVLMNVAQDLTGLGSVGS